MKCLLFILSLSAFSATAEEPQQMVEALRAEVRTEAKTLPPSDTRRADLFHSLGYVLASLTPENDLMTDRSLRDLSSALTGLQFVSDSPKVQKLCEALLAEIRQQAAQHSQEYLEKVTTELREALRQGLAATSPGEIDAPLAQVIRLRSAPFLRDAFHLRPAAYLVNDAEDLLVCYQDVLMAGQKASPLPKRDVIEKLRQSAEFHSPRLAALIPRSELLERVQTILQRVPNATTRLTQEELDEQIKTLIASLHKPEEMADAEQKIAALLDGQRALGNPLRVYSADRFRKWYASYQAVLRGAPLDRFSYFEMSHAGSFTPIENVLRPLVLARVLDLPRDLAQQEGESLDDFILRAFKSACSVSDWAMAGRIAEFARLGNLEMVISPSDQAGLKSLRSAATEEEAGSYDPAVADYLNALASGSQLIPLDHIRQRLQELRQKHPDDYAAGMESFHTRQQRTLPTFPKPSPPSRAKP